MLPVNLYMPFHAKKGTPLQVALVVCRASIGSLILQAFLQYAPYLVMLLHSSVDALEVTQDIHPDILFLEYALPENTGIALYDALRAQRLAEEIPTFIMGVLSSEQEDEVSRRQLRTLQWQTEEKYLFSALNDIFERPASALDQNLVCG